MLIEKMHPHGHISYVSAIRLLFFFIMRNNVHRADPSVTAAGSLHLILSEFVCRLIVPDSGAHAT